MVAIGPAAGRSAEPPGGSAVARGSVSGQRGATAAGSMAALPRPAAEPPAEGIAERGGSFQSRWQSALAGLNDARLADEDREGALTAQTADGWPEPQQPSKPAAGGAAQIQAGRHRESARAQANPAQAISGTQAVVSRPQAGAPPRPPAVAAEDVAAPQAAAASASEKARPSARRNDLARENGPRRSMEAQESTPTVASGLAAAVTAPGLGLPNLAAPSNSQVVTDPAAALDTTAELPDAAAPTVLPGERAAPTLAHEQWTGAARAAPDPCREIPMQEPQAAAPASEFAPRAEAGSGDRNEGHLAAVEPVPPVEAEPGMGQSSAAQAVPVNRGGVAIAQDAVARRESQPALQWGGAPLQESTKSSEPAPAGPIAASTGSLPAPARAETTAVLPGKSGRLHSGISAPATRGAAQQTATPAAGQRTVRQQGAQGRQGGESQVAAAKLPAAGSLPRQPVPARVVPAGSNADSGAAQPETRRALHRTSTDAHTAPGAKAGEGSPVSSAANGFSMGSRGAAVLDSMAMRPAAGPAAGPSAGADVALAVGPPAQAGSGTPSHAPALSNTAAAGANASQEAFSALDGEAAAGAPRWVHAGARQAEAGFEDPDLGWVGVRAEMGAGGIHAAILPGSVDAAQALSGHLAGLNAHLAAEHVPVQSLSMAAAAGRDGDAGMQQGNGHEGQGQSQGADQNRGFTGSARSGRQFVAPDAIGVNIPAGAAAPMGQADSAVTGTHISVVA